MKKLLIRIFALLTLAAVLLSSASCGSEDRDDSPAVMTLNECKITSAMYNFWAEVYKGNYLSTYEDVQNTAECWNKPLEGTGKTVAEYFDSVTLEQIKYTLVSMKLFDDYGLSFTDEQENSIDDYITDLVKEYAGESDEQFDAMLEMYGIDRDILRRICIEDAKSTKVYDCLYGENGRTPVTEAQSENYYNENYIRFQMIYINNKYRYALDENGNTYTDDKGYYVTEDMEASEKAKKDEKIAEAEKKLSDGEAFDSVYEEYSELKAYPDGYYYEKSEAQDDSFAELIKAVSSIDAGETAKVEIDTGTCIVKKLELDSGAWKNPDNADFFDGFDDAVGDSVYREFLTGYFKNITVDENAVKDFSVAKVTPVYFY